MVLMAIELPSNSRFVDTEVISKNGNETFGRWKRPIWFDNLREDEIRTITIANDRIGRPDLIALDLYGSPFLEWTLVMLNKPKDTLGWPRAGTVIKAIRPGIVLANI